MLLLRRQSQIQTCLAQVRADDGGRDEGEPSLLRLPGMRADADAAGCVGGHRQSDGQRTRAAWIAVAGSTWSFEQASWPESPCAARRPANRRPPQPKRRSPPRPAGNGPAPHSRGWPAKPCAAGAAARPVLRSASAMPQSEATATGMERRRPISQWE